MSKKEYTWGTMLDRFEDQLREEQASGKYVDPRGFFVLLRTIKRASILPNEELLDVGEGSFFDREINKSHVEYSEYLRLGEMFGPIVDQYRRIKYPSSREDFHAAWVKAGEE